MIDAMRSASMDMVFEALLKINSKCSKYHFKSLSEEVDDEGLEGD